MAITIPVPKKSVWVLTCEYNDYDQHGPYFIAAWRQKPTKEQLEGLTDLNEKGIEHLLTNGGGRHGVEYQWFYLAEYAEGENGHDSE